jgi:hypothetical protein
MSKSQETKMHRIFKLLSAIPVKERPNLLLISDNETLFCHRERLTVSLFAVGYGFVEGINPERGDVMDFFVDIELIVNQILVARFTKDSDTAQQFEQLLDSIDLFSKIRLLNEWSLIDNSTKEKLFCLKEVRNGFAHRWNIKDINYRSRSVLENFQAFKKDAAEVLNKLIKLYNGGDIDLDVLLAKLEKKPSVKKDK